MKRIKSLHWGKVKNVHSKILKKNIVEKPEKQVDSFKAMTSKKRQEIESLKTAALVWIVRKVNEALQYNFVKEM